MGEPFEPLTLRRRVRHRIAKALDSPASTGSGKQFNITFNGREKGKGRRGREGERERGREVG